MTSICPKCGYEYEPHIYKCSDCDVDLVHAANVGQQPRKSEKRKEEFKEWVHLQTFPGVVFAEMAKGLLEQQEIPSMIKRPFLSSAYGSFGTGGAGVDQADLHVPRIHFERAEMILHDYLEEPGAGERSDGMLE